MRLVASKSSSSSAPRLLLVACLLWGLCGCEERSPDAVVAADTLFRAGRHEAAALAYAHLPDDAGSWRAYGAWRSAVIYRDALGDSVRAQKGFQQCTSRFPMNSWGYACLVDLGDLRRQERRFRAAINSYRAALEQRPRGEHAEHCLLQSGHSYLALGEFEQARVEWQELGREFPASKQLARIALDRARSFDLQGRYKEALEAYRTVIEEFTEDEVTVAAAYGVAEAYEQLGMLDEAEAAYQAVIGGHPNRALVELKLRSLLSRRSRRDRAPTQVIQHGRVLNPAP